MTGGSLPADETIIGRRKGIQKRRPRLFSFFLTARVLIPTENILLGKFP